MNIGIYIIKNRINGHSYIGSTENYKRRRSDHRRSLDNRTHWNHYLQKAWNKYGATSFTFSFYIACKKSDLLFYEQRCFDVLKPEYNLLPTAGSPRGYKHTAESLMKQRIAQIGRKHSDETRQKMSRSAMGNQRTLGRHHSAESRQKMGISRIGIPRPHEVKEKISKALKGIPLSVEHRKKISEGLLRRSK